MQYVTYKKTLKIRSY